MSCVKCDNPLELGKILKCSECSNEYHYSCSGIEEEEDKFKEKVKTGEAEWTCLNCQRRAGSSNEIASVVNSKFDGFRKEIGNKNITRDDLKYLEMAILKGIRGPLEEMNNRLTTLQYSTIQCFKLYEQLSAQMSSLQSHLMPSSDAEDVAEDDAESDQGPRRRRAPWACNKLCEVADENRNTILKVIFAIIPIVHKLRQNENARKFFRRLPKLVKFISKWLGKHKDAVPPKSSE